MPWRAQTFWLVGSRTEKRLLAISAVSGSRARCRHQGPVVDKDAQCKRDTVFRATNADFRAATSAPLCPD